MLHEQSHNNCMKETFKEIFGSSSYDDSNEDAYQASEGVSISDKVGEGSNINQGKQKVLKRKFWMEWLEKIVWLNYFQHDGKIVMKCNYCEKYNMLDPWGIGDGFRNLQCDALVTHEKSVIHKDAQAR